ncbi:SDR family NAD(P)-dependent oxidoreductase [Amycolatopsis sp. ATCC 39116]|uniref:SDR family NAD(P)-dependent oxidoreductase n=1 Tax=Amycolatopsis sp. (strain ATCC 39116 / 75iv2) TaxID=385957 RepID=UPI0002626519|nr:SDR family NAD(P)-dependent oxidoreductase [Amycolatopsis sp. ATCC 39116]
MNALDAKVALVTGGGSGLGREIVERFVAQGARVGVLERDSAKAENLSAGLGSAVAVTVGDVRSARDNEAAVARTVDAFGPLDVFIGNAGVWDFGASLVDIPIDTLGCAFDDLYGINVKGYLLGARAAVDALRSSRGVMIFTLSNAAFLPGGGGPLYTSSKHAIVGLIRQLAYELEGQVRVNGVAPGLMPTDLRGLPSLGQDAVSLGDLIGEQLDGAGTAGVRSAGDYVMGYVLLASSGARVTNGAIFEMHGMLSAPARQPVPPVADVPAHG